MKNLKILIISIIISIIVIAGILIIRKSNEVIEVAPYIEFKADGTKVKPELLNTQMYFTIDDCCEEILKYAQNNNNEAVYRLLSKNYKSNNNITQDNVFDVIKLNTIKKYKTLKIYRSSLEDYAMYFVNGITDSGEIYFNINIDIAQSTFDFEPIDKNSYEKYIQTEVPVHKKTIIKNSYNAISYKKLSQLDIAEKYLLDFIENAIEFPELAYNSLDKEYRNSKFATLDEFKKYISNKTEMKNIYDYYLMNSYGGNEYVGISKYNKEKLDGYTKYTCTDTSNNTYTFYVTSVMQYSVVLDY